MYRPRVARRVIPLEDVERYRVLRQVETRGKAARAVGISYTTAQKIDAGEKVGTPLAAISVGHGSGQTGRRDQTRVARYDGDELPEPMDLTNEGELTWHARNALHDFAYWRKRYLGRLSTPWQEEAAYQVVEWIATQDKEYVVVNAPPGSGKSTLFTHDIPVWLACRDRSLRVLIGSRTERQAKQYVGRARRTFDRRRPVAADPNELALGLATDAVSTLVADYGRFKPLLADLWRMDEFVLAQPDDQTVEDKEPSFAAYGMDSGFLGSRANVVVWDDLADKITMKTVDAREGIRKWWDEEGETRLEPGGVLILQGQRMGPEDIYRYALDMVGGDDDDDAETDDEGNPIYDPWRLVNEDDRGNAIIDRKYRHIVYRAHDESRCRKQHKKTDPYWPDGCLLDPRRLPWGGAEGLRTIMRNKAEKYLVLYQQEDTDPATVLVKPVWVDGGMDEDGFMAPGCWDNDRGLCELPRGLAGQLLSICTADPSPTKYWAVQWWIVRIDEHGPQERYLMDLLKETLEAPDMLDWSHEQHDWTGIMEEWQLRSIQLGVPITHWIVEANAAQRFMLQYEHVKRWMARRSVAIYPHQTHLNKNKEAEEYGVETIAPHYKFGRVRLPGSQRGRARYTSMKLREEVTKYPEGRTDDQVMAHWFLEWRLPMLYRPPGGQPRARRPDWMTAEPSIQETMAAISLGMR